MPTELLIIDIHHTLRIGYNDNGALYLSCRLYHNTLKRDNPLAAHVTPSSANLIT